MNTANPVRPKPAPTLTVKSSALGRRGPMELLPSGPPGGRGKRAAGGSSHFPTQTLNP